MLLRRPFSGPRMLGAFGFAKTTVWCSEDESQKPLPNHEIEKYKSYNLNQDYGMHLKHNRCTAYGMGQFGFGMKEKFYGIGEWVRYRKDQMTPNVNDTKMTTTNATPDQIDVKPMHYQDNVLINPHANPNPNPNPNPKQIQNKSKTNPKQIQNKSKHRYSRFFKILYIIIFTNINEVNAKGIDYRHYCHELLGDSYIKMKEKIGEYHRRQDDLGKHLHGKDGVETWLSQLQNSANPPGTWKLPQLTKLLADYEFLIRFDHDYKSIDRYAEKCQIFKSDVAYRDIRESPETQKIVTRTKDHRELVTKLTNVYDNRNPKSSVNKSYLQEVIQYYTALANHEELEESLKRMPFLKYIMIQANVDKIQEVINQLNIRIKAKENISYFRKAGNAIGKYLPPWTRSFLSLEENESESEENSESSTGSSFLNQEELKSYQTSENVKSSSAIETEMINV